MLFNNLLTEYPLFCIYWIHILITSFIAFSIYFYRSSYIVILNLSRSVKFGFNCVIFFLIKFISSFSIYSCSFNYSVFKLFYTP